MQSRLAWMAVVALLAISGLPTPAAAQEAPLELLREGTGDVVTTVAATPTPVPADRFQALDLVALSALEDVGGFQLVLTVASLAQEDGTPFADSGLMHIYFQYSGETYRVEWVRQANPGGAYHYADLMVQERLDDYSYVTSLASEVDEDAGTLTTYVPRFAIQDRDGASPVPGQSLAAFAVESLATGEIISFGGESVVPGGRTTDRMPDEGTGPGLDIRFGVLQEGNAFLWSNTPARASNGEATTFVFTVMASNFGDAEDRFDLSVANVPANWDVALPAPTLRIQSNDTVEVPVVLAVPFAHDHGSFERFLLEMKSQTDPGSVGRIELGVRYTAVPQPAGHHNTLYFHSREEYPGLTPDGVDAPFIGSYPFSYMNAAEEDPADDQMPVPAYSQGSSGLARRQYGWYLYLSPILEMGLDMDLTGSGTLKVPISTTAPLTGAVLSGTVWHVGSVGDDDYESVAIANIGPTAATDIGFNSQALLEAPVLVTEESDYLPFSDFSYLYVELMLESDGVPVQIGDADVPQLVPGGSLQLPLLEYHDPVDEVFASLSNVRIEPLGDQERWVNPGETVLFNFSLRNGGFVDDRYTITASGTNADWANVLGDGTFGLAAGDNRTLVVAIRAPNDAIDGAMSDLVVTATSVTDPNVKALMRIRASVDTAIDRPDEAALLEDLDRELSEDKGSPGLPFMLGLLAVVALAMLRRRF